MRWEGDLSGNPWRDQLFASRSNYYAGSTAWSFTTTAVITPVENNEVSPAARFSGRKIFVCRMAGTGVSHRLHLRGEGFEKSSGDRVNPPQHVPAYCAVRYGSGRRFFRLGLNGCIHQSRR